MEITSAKYMSSVEGINSHIMAKINGVEMAVPINDENRHFKAIQKWVADGNSIEAAD